MPELEPSSLPRRTQPLRAILLAIALAFAGGLGLMAWALSHWNPHLHWGSNHTVVPDDPTSQPQPAPFQSPAHSTPPLLPAATQSQVAGLSARMDEIEQEASAASGEASRAEQIMIAFAARRAIDRGVPLGYLEGVLNQRFGTTQPRAVANIIAASHAPVTLDGLHEQLDAIAPETDPATARSSWWSGVQRDLGSLFTIRRADQPSTRPEERLVQARLALSAGAVDRAMAAVARLPGGPRTSAWLADARRYTDAHTALDVIEASVLMKNDSSLHADTKSEQSGNTSASSSGASSR